MNGPGAAIPRTQVCLKINYWNKNKDMVNVYGKPDSRLLRRSATNTVNVS